jgi:hypothetical protein
VDFKFQLPAMFILFVFHNSVHIESFSSFEDLSAYRSHGPTLNGTILHPPQMFENTTIAIFESSDKGNKDSKRLAGMSMIFHVMKLHFSMCNCL